MKTTFIAIFSTIAFTSLFAFVIIGIAAVAFHTDKPRPAPPLSYPGKLILEFSPSGKVTNVANYSGFTISNLQLQVVVLHTNILEQP